MAGPMTTLFSPCRPQMALQVRYLALNPNLTIWLSPRTMYRISNRFLGLRLRVSSDGRAWTSSRGPGKICIWSKKDDEEMTLPDPEVLLVYSLHFAQQGRQDWEDELPPEAMGRMNRQEKREEQPPCTWTIVLRNWRA